MENQNIKSEKRVKSTHAAAAQAIRQDLKKAFPGVKFRVRSSSFSMGNSVDVDWTDGPTRSEVDRIIGRYQYGHFDGMQDLYEYSNRRDDLPQAKYVSGSRSMSEEVRADLLAYVAERFFEPEEREGVTENTRMPNGGWWVQEQVWREFAERSYTTPAQWMPEEGTAEEPEQPEPVEDAEPRPMYASIMQPQEVDPEAELDELIRSRVLGMMQLEAMACITEVRQ